MPKLLQLGNTLTNLIGDPHLGKKFIDGVPLHRRGERERSVLAHFEGELNVPCRLNVCLGDIFDKFTVDTSTVIATYLAMAQAAEAQPETTFVVVMGNHDAQRDMSSKSSFQLLQYLLGQFENVVLVTHIKEMKIGDDKFLFVPFHPVKTQTELVYKYFVDPCQPNQFTAVFGHWEVDSFGGEDHQLMPIEELKVMTNTIITGHIHEAKEYQDGAVRVIVTGSLEPYSFGEDSAGALYRTEDLDTVSANLLLDPNYYKDICLRVRVGPNQALPEVNCLQLKVVANMGAEPVMLEAKMEHFSFEQLFHDHLRENDVPEDLIKQTWEKYHYVE